MPRNGKNLPQPNEPQLFLESVLVVSSGSDEDSERDGAESGWREAKTGPQREDAPCTAVSHSFFTHHNHNNSNVHTSRRLKEGKPSSAAAQAFSVQPPPPEQLSFRRAYPQPHQQQPQQLQQQGPAAATPHEDTGRAERHAGLQSTQTRDGKKLYSYRPRFSTSGTADTSPSPKAPTETIARRQRVLLPSTGASEQEAKKLPMGLRSPSTQEVSSTSPLSSSAAGELDRPCSFHALQLASGEDGVMARNVDSGLGGGDDGGDESSEGVAARGPSSRKKVVRHEGQHRQGSCPLDPVAACCCGTSGGSGELQHMPCVLRCLTGVYAEQQRLKQHLRLLQRQGELQQRQIEELQGALRLAAKTAPNEPRQQHPSPSSSPLYPATEAESLGKGRKRSAKAAREVSAAAHEEGRERGDKVLAGDVQTPTLSRGAATSMRESTSGTAASGSSPNNSNPYRSENATEGTTLCVRKSLGTPGQEMMEVVVVGGGGDNVNDSPPAQQPEKALRGGGAVEAHRKKLPATARCPADVTSTVTSFADATGVQVSAANSRSPDHDDDSDHSAVRGDARQHHPPRRGRRSTTGSSNSTSNTHANSFDGDEEDDESGRATTSGHRKAVVSCFASFQVREDSVSSISSASCDYADEDDAGEAAGVVQQIEELISVTASQAARGDDNLCGGEQEKPATPLVYSTHATGDTAQQQRQLSPPSAPSLMSQTKTPSQMPPAAAARGTVGVGGPSRFNAPPLPWAPLSHLPPTYPTTPTAPALLLAAVSPREKPQQHQPQTLHARAPPAQVLPLVGSSSSRRSSLSVTAGSSSGSVATMPATVSPLRASQRPATLSPLPPPPGALCTLVPALPMQRPTIIRKEGGGGGGGGGEGSSSSGSATAAAREPSGVLSALPVNISANTAAKEKGGERSRLSSPATMDRAKSQTKPKKQRTHSAAAVPTAASCSTSMQGRFKGMIRDTHATSTIEHRRGDGDGDDECRRLTGQYKSETNLRQLQH